MTEADYNECLYIEKVMCFYTYDDFIKFRFQIKREYQKLKNPIFYKWYVYSNISCSLKQKNLIWEYLNNDGDDSLMLKRGRE